MTFYATPEQGARLRAAYSATAPRTMSFSTWLVDLVMPGLEALEAQAGPFPPVDRLPSGPTLSE